MLETQWYNSEHSTLTVNATIHNTDGNMDAQTNGIMIPVRPANTRSYLVVMEYSSVSHDEACVFAAESVNYGDPLKSDVPSLAVDSRKQHINMANASNESFLMASIVNCNINISLNTIKEILV